MKKNQIILFSVLLGCLGLTAQEKSKTYKETFNVGNDAVLEINTTHVDIEFETWDKNEVEITAVIELDGASEEEAARYFEKSPIEIKGNSQEIEISTSNRNSLSFALAGESFNLVAPDIEPLFLDLEIPEMPEMPELAVIPDMPPLPPMPPMPFANFDYKEFQKDGEKYMKKWKKEFDKSFDEEYKKRFEEWGKEMEERSEIRKELFEERQELREEAREDRQKAMKELQQVREEQRRALQEQRKALRDQVREQRDVLISSGASEAPNIFYFSADGEKKKYKVKKTIKVKMPKSVKLKMNVRHGEVKLAELAKDINASLQYASLFGATIDGSGTNIRASYSPVVIQKWNIGELKTDYSENVNIKVVGELKLNSVSSNVVIDRITKKGNLTNNFGVLQINSISNNFSDMDIIVKNGELNCKMPSGAFLVEVNETGSELKYPARLVLEKTSNLNNVLHKGYHINKNGSKSIHINSKYSEVVLEN